MSCHGLDLDLVHSWYRPYWPEIKPFFNILLTFFIFKAFYKLGDYFNSLACLALPDKMVGTFKLTEMVDSSIEGVISGHHLSELIIK